MIRRFLFIAAFSSACLPASSTKAAADDDDFRQALALESTVKAIVKRVEPSVACILVSRSDKYRTVFKDIPRGDTPGYLGGLRPPQNDVEKGLDLANPANVPESFGSGEVVSAPLGLGL